ncbi:MAG: PAS domain S-box protein [Chlamydiae bacterium]|nr:PAS domain S-box protein [Chlamydiota bacterium]MBI3266855.1 PAS domain S-box protein [Chlamydiota bacterium]
MEPLEKYLDSRNVPQEVREAIRKEFDERRRVEEVLRRHAQMIDFANDTIMIRDLKDRITYWNQGAERLYGWSREEAMGMHVHSFLKTLFPRSADSAIQVCLRKGYWEGELKHLRKDGTRVTVASRWTLQRDEKGKPIAFLEINNDITQLKKTEGALLEARDQLEKRVEERTSELRATNDQLRQLIQERRALEKEILEISGMEQRRIGQDLHDGLSQQLMGIALMGKVLEKKLTQRALPHASHMRKIVELVNQAVIETRGLARGLYPVELEAHGLMSALDELASHVKKVFNVKCFFQCDRPILIKDNMVSTHLYRIVQEAVYNAVKHARPSEISIRLMNIGRRLLMEVKDDGVGFPKRLSPHKGMGIRIMRYRAEMIHASLEIGKMAKGGTLVSCSLENVKRRDGHEDGRGRNGFEDKA